MIVWIVIGLVAALILLGLALALLRRTAAGDPDPAPEALARYGTPEVAEMLEDEGRGHELHGLGFRDRR